MQLNYENIPQHLKQYFKPRSYKGCGVCYICKMVAVFREVKRVLRGDGVCFCNIGDSFAGNKEGNTNGTGAGGKSTGKVQQKDGVLTDAFRKELQAGMKPKDMLLIPQRLALALQADGWWIRSEIIWHKPNPMPESVTDRPTKSHETIWLMSKSKNYFWDAEAVREEGVCDDPREIQSGLERSRLYGYDTKEFQLRPPRKNDGQDTGGNGSGIRNHNGNSLTRPDRTRNLRDVWTIATQPYSGAHYATYPEALVERCIKAGTSERGVCPKCGKQWEREIEKAGGTIGKGWADHKGDMTQGMSQLGCSGLGEKDNGNGKYRVTTLGFRSSCSCGLDPIPATVLDPFAGSGTTCLVAKRMGRSAIGLDLSYQYLRENAWERVGMNAPQMEGI